MEHYGVLCGLSVKAGVTQWKLLSDNIFNMQHEATGNGKHPKPVYPAKFDDIAGMAVPKGGSSCKTCEYLKDRDKKLCGEPNFIKWNFGSNIIPTNDIDAYCSIWYEPR